MPEYSFMCAMHEIWKSDANVAQFLQIQNSIISGIVSKLLGMLLFLRWSEIDRINRIRVIIRRIVGYILTVIRV